MKLGRLLLRVIVGGLFVGHGSQKLFGSFGGHGLKATAEGFDQMGLKPGKVTATAAGVAETAGGAALAAGLHTPLAAASLIGVMTVAVKKVHLSNGPWAGQGGYEYNLVLAAAAATIAEAGPGSISLDHLRGKERSGLLWGLFALVGGVGGALAVEQLSARGGGEPPIPAPDDVPGPGDASTVSSAAADTTVTVTVTETELPETPISNWASEGGATYGGLAVDPESAQSGDDPVIPEEQ